MYVAFAREMYPAPQPEIISDSDADLLKKMVDSGVNALMLIDGNGDIIYSNRAARKVFGFEQMKSLSMNISDFPTVFPDRIRKLISEGDEIKGKMLFEGHFRNILNQQMFIEISLQSLTYEDRVIYYFDGRDVNRRKETENELTESRINETLALSLQDRFFSNVSHEMGNPFSALLGMLDLVKKEELSKDNRRYIENAAEAAGRLSAMAQDIILLARIRDDEYKVNPVNFEVRRCIDYIESLFRKRAEKKGLIFEVRSTFETLDFYGDKIKIIQIVSQLLENAVKFSHSGKIELVFGYNGCLLIEIKNTGSFIMKENIENIFLPFYQEETPYSGKNKGAGIGLSIVRELLNLMNGRISVQSGYDRGTVFSLKIPPC